MSLPRGLAVLELVENPQGEGLQDLAGCGGLGSAAPEHVAHTSPGTRGQDQDLGV